MNVYIVDSNLLFSAAIKAKFSIRRFIMHKDNYDVRLYAPALMKLELENHFDRMVKASKLSPVEIKFNLDKLCIHITFIDDDIIPWNNYIEALRIVRDIDPYDVTFVALNDYMDKVLWKGDRQLYAGLKAKGYDRVIDFEEIKRIYSLK